MKNPQYLLTSPIASTSQAIATTTNPILLYSRQDGRKTGRNAFCDIRCKSPSFRQRCQRRLRIDALDIFCDCSSENATVPVFPSERAGCHARQTGQGHSAFRPLAVMGHRTPVHRTGRTNLFKRRLRSGNVSTASGKYRPKSWRQNRAFPWVSSRNCFAMNRDSRHPNWIHGQPIFENGKIPDGQGRGQNGRCPVAG